MATSEERRWLTTREAAEMLEVTTSQVRYLCIRGELAAEKPGHDWLIDRESVEQYTQRPTRHQGRGRPKHNE